MKIKRKTISSCNVIIFLNMKENPEVVKEKNVKYPKTRNSLGKKYLQYHNR